MESIHPYSKNCSDIWLCTVKGATYIKLTFDSKTNIDEGFDYLYIYDSDGNQIGKYTGTELANKTVDISGNTVKIKLVSDDSVNTWGFKVSDVDTDGNVCTHEWGEWTVTTAATCTEKGIETRTCSACGKTETRDIEPIGHTEVIDEAKEPNCTETGLTEGKHCSVCGSVTVEQQVIEALGHKIEIIPGKNATETEPGLTRGKKCSVCGKILKEQVVIPAGTTNIAVESTKLDEEYYTVSGRTVTIAYSKSCKVGYLEGDKYVAIEAEANDDGSYSYTAPEGITEVLIVIKGDVDGDGNVQGNDVTQLKAAYLGKKTLTAEQLFAGDVDGSGEVAGNDVTQLKAAYLGKRALTW